MASGFFALFDDIAVLMDDVAAMSKLATRKTAGILTDDLAVNAEKASGFVSSREIPVLWQITKGSFINKLIILPVAFLLSAYWPVAIVPILLIGGVYLAYEGAEKIYEFLFHRGQAKTSTELTEMTEEEAQAYEKGKVKSAIFVDLVLSAEIVFIALSTVAGQPMPVQIMSVTVVAIFATIGVYGLVALLVRMDDFGYKLIATSQRVTSIKAKIGQVLVKSLPILIRILEVVGTIAMLLVAGGIFVHNVHAIHNLVHALPSIIGEFLVGLAVGIIAVLIMMAVNKIKGKQVTH